MMKLFTAVTATVLSVAALSADSFFRVDIAIAKGAPKARLSSPADKNANMRLGPMGFVAKAEQPYTLNREIPIKDKDNWKTVVFTVRAEKDTKIRVSFRGNDGAGKVERRTWSYISDFKLDGKLIPNGDLAQCDKSGKIIGFEVPNMKNFYPAAKNGGKNAFLISYGNSISRTFELKGGKTYLFSASLKAAKAPAAKK